MIHNSTVVQLYNACFLMFFEMRGAWAVDFPEFQFRRFFFFASLAARRAMVLPLPLPSLLLLLLLLLLHSFSCHADEAQNIAAARAAAASMDLGFDGPEAAKPEGTSLRTGPSEAAVLDTEAQAAVEADPGGAADPVSLLGDDAATLPPPAVSYLDGPEPAQVDPGSTDDSSTAQPAEAAAADAAADAAAEAAVAAAQVAKERADDSEQAPSAAAPGTRSTDASRGPDAATVPSGGEGEGSSASASASASSSSDTAGLVAAAIDSAGRRLRDLVMLPDHDSQLAARVKELIDTVVDNIAALSSSGEAADDASSSSSSSSSSIRSAVVLWKDPTHRSRTALHVAARAGNVGVARSLIEAGGGAGAAARLPDSTGYTPLHAASEHGRIGVMRLLLAGADDPLHAASGGVPPMGTPTNARTFRRGHTPLHLAAQKAIEPAVAVLLQHGADLEATCWEAHGTTPIDAARARGHFHLVRGLKSPAAVAAIRGAAATDVKWHESTRHQQLDAVRAALAEGGAAAAEEGASGHLIASVQRGAVPSWALLEAVDGLPLLHEEL